MSTIHTHSPQVYTTLRNPGVLFQLLHENLTPGQVKSEDQAVAAKSSQGLIMKAEFNVGPGP